MLTLSIWSYYCGKPLIIIDINMDIIGDSFLIELSLILMVFS